VIALTRHESRTCGKVPLLFRGPVEHGGGRNGAPARCSRLKSGGERGRVNWGNQLVETLRGGGDEGDGMLFQGRAGGRVRSLKTEDYVGEE